MKKLIRTLTLAILLLLVLEKTNAQNVGVNENGHLPDPSAMLDVNSTKRGFLVPRMTEVQREAIVAPANGLLVYQTNEQMGFWYFRQSKWQRLQPEVLLGLGLSLDEDGYVQITPSGVQDGTYGSGSTYPIFEVDKTGQITKVIEQSFNDNDSLNELQSLKLSNDTLFISEGNFVVLGNMVRKLNQNQYQHISLNQDTLSISNGNYVVLNDDKTFDGDSSITNELQTLSKSGKTISLSRSGGTIVLNDDDSNNEIQSISISNDTVFLSSGGSIILPPKTIDTDDQTLRLSNDTLYIANGNFVVLDADQTFDGDSSSTNEIQTISKSGSTITLSNSGGSFNLLDDDASNELQTISISGDTVYLTNGGFVPLPSGTVDTDDQTLRLSNDTLFIADGNFVVLDADQTFDGDSSTTNEIQTISKSGSTITLSNSGGSFNLLDDDASNELQTISISGDTVYLTNGGFVPLPAGTVDTDDQTLRLSNDTLFIADGNFVVLDPDQTFDGDSSTTNEIQTISKSGSTITLSNSGGSFNLLDDDASNELQTISISGDTVYLTNGGFVPLPSGTVDTDDQTLRLSNDTLY